MCLLSYYPPNAVVNREHLACGAECNPHGHGYAVVLPDGSDIIVGHSMDPDVVLDEFVALRDLYPDSYALFHSRITTHGTTSLDNCHPFIVKGLGPQGLTVLAHNGILPANCQPRRGDKRSDTRILADSLIQGQYPALDKPATRDRLEAWLGRGSKVLILTTNPRYKETAYLFNEALGDWTGGVWHSNDSWSAGRGWWTSGYSYTPLRRMVETASTSPWDTSTWERRDSGIYAVRGVEGADTGVGYGDDYPLRTMSKPGHTFLSWECDECNAVGMISRTDFVCDWCGNCYFCGKGHEVCQDGCMNDPEIQACFGGADRMFDLPHAAESVEPSVPTVIRELTATPYVEPPTFEEVEQPFTNLLMRYEQVWEKAMSTTFFRGEYVNPDKNVREFWFADGMIKRTYTGALQHMREQMQKYEINYFEAHTFLKDKSAKV